MNTNFTPGPWVAIKAPFRWHGDDPIFTDGLWWILPEYHTERLPITVVDKADDHDEATRAKAVFDAQLIAAAPEMYDLLASIENDAQQVPAWLWGKIQNVLAKARGEVEVAA
jgi:hypothetical protein